MVEEIRLVLFLPRVERKTDMSCLSCVIIECMYYPPSILYNGSTYIKTWNTRLPQIHAFGLYCISDKYKHFHILPEYFWLFKICSSNSALSLVSSQLTYLFYNMYIAHAAIAMVMIHFKCTVQTQFKVVLTVFIFYLCVCFGCECEHACPGVSCLHPGSDPESHNEELDEAA